MTPENEPKSQSRGWIEQLRVSGLMGSWDPGGTASGAGNMTTMQKPIDHSQGMAGKPYGFTSKDLCAVPVGLCHVVKEGTTVPESMELLSPDIRVMCTNPGCDYGGPVHQNCLDRWISCCELRCRMLTTVPPTSPQSGLCTDASNAMFDGLLALYRCPQCGQCSLCRVKMNCLSEPVPTPADPHVSLFGTIQYVNQQTNQTSTPGSILPVSDRVPTTSNLTENASSTLAEEDRFGTDTPMEHRKLTSWHTVWSNSLTSSGSLSQHQINPHPQIKRRLSLRCSNSMGNNSSGSTSGFGSSFLGSSFSAAGDMSFQSSRRSSRNTCASDISDVFRTVQPGTENAGSMNDDIVNTGWSGTTTVPRALRRAGLSTLTRHSVSGSGYIHPELGLSAVDSMLPSGSFSSVDPANLEVSDDSRPVCESASAMHLTSASGRRHHSTSCVGASKGPSFWPSEPTPGTKSLDADGQETEKRKVVSRKGNIFRPREDFAVFQSLPAYKRNAYFIQMDDDSCTGNEDTRAFLLAQLTNHRVSEVACLACHQSLIVYDHFPVIDGVFFISPVCHRSTDPLNVRKSISGLRVTWNTNGVPGGVQTPKLSGANADLDDTTQQAVRKLLGYGQLVVPPPGCLGPRQQVSGAGHGMTPDNSLSQFHQQHPHQHHQQNQNSVGGRHELNGGRQQRYLHALCLGCIHHDIPPGDGKSASSGTPRICCRSCHRPWSGSGLLVGGLYTYDVLAAWPCCSDRFTCNSCGRCLFPNSNERSTGDLVHVEKENAANQHQDAGTAINSTYPFPFFSQYSQLITCPFCTTIDYHFVKPFDKQFVIKTDL